MPFSSLWMSPYPLENCLRALIQFSVAGDWDLSGWASMGLLSHYAFLQWGGWNWGRLFLRSFPNTTSKREEKSTENNGLRSHLWDTTAVGCHLVDTDIVDLSDLGHDPILIITCGITQSWLDTVISGWTTLTYVYDFDLMTLFLLSNIKQYDKHCAVITVIMMKLTSSNCCTHARVWESHARVLIKHTFF